jgi:hypothetical protein
MHIQKRTYERLVKIRDYLVNKPVGCNKADITVECQINKTVLNNLINLGYLTPSEKDPEKKGKTYTVTEKLGNDIAAYESSITDKASKKAAASEATEPTA